MNRGLEMAQIRRLINLWIGEIRSYNYDNYYDINKVSEHLARELLNGIFGYELEDLNKIKVNYPGLDIGDMKKSLIAFQVTSRTDARKIIENLETVVKNKSHETFSNGIKFLILNDVDKVRFGKKAKKKPADVLATFVFEKDILYPSDLIHQIEEIYEREADLVKFSRIKHILTKELVSIPSTEVLQEANKELEKLKKLIEQVEQKESNVSHIKISRSFFTTDLAVPKITVAVNRDEIVTALWEVIQQKDIVWLYGSPSTGKTSLAYLVTAQSKSLWIECRDIPAAQIIEHLVTAITAHYKLTLKNTFKETLEAVFPVLEAGSLLILNDLPDLTGDATRQQQLADFINTCTGANVNLLATSTLLVPTAVLEQNQIELIPFAVPAFTETDTEALLKFMGAPEEEAMAFSGLVTNVTEGHPLIIRSIGKYLNDHQWQVDTEAINAIFTTKFSVEDEREIYKRVVDYTEDDATKELLYRLRYVLGSFDFSVIERIGNIDPKIEHLAEKIAKVKGVWLQESDENKYQLSPVIKRLDGNIDTALKKEINKQLAWQVLEKQNISQMDASTVIFYLIHAAEYNQAAFVLIKVLVEFSKNPQLFFDWNFDMYWFSVPLPEEMIPLLKSQIRVFQITICMSLNKDYQFLLSDLKKITQEEEVGPLGQGINELLFFQIDAKDNPVSATRSLINAGKHLADADRAMESNTFSFDEAFLNGIWVGFSQIKNLQEYEGWFASIEGADLPASITDHYHNDLYIMAGVSIYKNVFDNGRTKEENRILLTKLIKSGRDSGLILLAIYAVKDLIRYLANATSSMTEALEVVEENKDIIYADPVFRFLVEDEIGRQYYYAGEIDEAVRYLSVCVQLAIPDLYTERSETLLILAKSVFSKSKTEAAGYIVQAFELVSQNEKFGLEEKLKVYGETGIVLTHTGQYQEALRILSKGFGLLLDSFKDTEEFHALIIRYGHAVLFLSQSLIGDVSKFGDGLQFTIPKPGFFYMTNERLLEGGFYFEERKFMVATIIQGTFESSGNFGQARKWAYRSIDLAMELKEGQFVPILQKIIIYLVHDFQFRQAYNVLAYVAEFYANLLTKIEKGELADEELKAHVQEATKRKSIKSDFDIYFLILLPAAFEISKRINAQTIAEAEYSELINILFSNEKHIILEPEDFSFAKEMFQKILIDKISFGELQQLLNSYNGSNREILSYIGFILLSNFTTVLEAFKLQLTVATAWNHLFRTSSQGVYRLTIIPFFENFWKSRLINQPSEFSSKELLYKKGLPLVEQAGWQNKVSKIFKVYANHLPVNPSLTEVEFMEQEIE